MSYWPFLLKAVAIALLTFVSEDAATFGSGFLAAQHLLPWPLAYTACFLGIWAGDLGLYAFARRWGRPWAELMMRRMRVPLVYLGKSEEWFKRKGIGALILCRFLPWSRLPTFLVAGLLRVSFGLFALITGVMAMIWVALIYALVGLLGKTAEETWNRWQGHALPVALILVGFLLVGWWMVHLWRRIPAIIETPLVQRWLRWEFWPAWFFYGPVGLHYLWLGLKYRSFTLPTAANPCMPTGGLVGESKYDILRQLTLGAPEYVAEAFLIARLDPVERVKELRELRERHEWSLPMVFKPDVGQRGVGFKIIKEWREGEHYVENIPGRVVVQRYVPGPFEVGVFYYRFPGENRGRIFAITEKIFPSLQGDGRRTVEQLIRQDERAVFMASTYLRRFATQRDRVLGKEETFRLVEAGNHAQGCIFHDGETLGTPDLEARIDQISRSLQGFFIGRYDLRYAQPEDLAQGRNFKIIELNGAASEATSIYDPRYSILQAYRTLFEQWSLVFAIGAENRRRGDRPDSLLRLWQEWKRFQRLSQDYPPAD